MDFITTFFAEKDLEEQIYEVTDKRPSAGIFGMTHIIPTGVVIEAIQRTTGDERRAIEATLRQLDLYNADIHHVLRHMAEGLANNS